MAFQFDNLTFLSKNKNKTVKLRLVRYYGRPTRENNQKFRGMEFVFHDVKGQRIHGTAPGCLAEKFKAFKLLEGRVYGINTFKVEKDPKNFKPTDSSHKFIFYKDTDIFEIVDEHYPWYMFNFKQFSDLTDPQTIDSTKMFDIIGCIVLYQSVQTTRSKGTEKRFIEVVLEDVDGSHLTCTLWEGYIEILLEAHRHCSANDLRIVILQFCHATALDDGSIIVANTYDTTKLIASSDIPEILDFKQRYDSHIRPKNSSSQIVRSFFSNVCEDLQSGSAPLTNVADFIASNEQKLFWIHGTIIDIACDWFFKSCPTCVRKVEPKGVQFWCNYCNHDIPFSILRYKLHITVGDNTGTLWLLCWDKVARELIGKTCDEVVNNMLKQDGGLQLPEEVHQLNDTSLLFKIAKKKDQFGSDCGPFTVSRITADPILIKQFSALGDPSKAVEGNKESKGEVNNPNKTAEASKDSTMINNPNKTVEGSKDSTMMNCPNKTVEDSKYSTMKRVQKKLFEDGSSYSEKLDGS